MKRFGVLSFQFYRLLLLYNLGCTLLAVFLVLFGSGSLSPANFLYAKIIGFAAAAGLHYYSSKNTYFYFRNAGYRVRQVIAAAFMFDMILYVLMVVIYIKAR